MSAIGSKSGNVDLIEARKSTVVSTSKRSQIEGGNSQYIKSGN